MTELLEERGLKVLTVTLREVPVVETVARELRAYLAARALPEDLQGIDGEHAAVRLRSAKHALAAAERRRHSTNISSATQ